MALEMNNANTTFLTVQWLLVSKIAIACAMNSSLGLYITQHLDQYSKQNKKKQKNLAFVFSYLKNHILTWINALCSFLKMIKIHGLSCSHNKVIDFHKISI